MKKILGLLIALLITTQAYASIAVAPNKIDINANKIKSNYVTTAIEVRGDTKQTIRFKAYSGYFTISEQSKMVHHEKSDDPHNIAKKIRFVPSEFTVQPGKVQKLRINIANLNSLPDGESRAVLYLEDVNAKEYNLDTGMPGIGAQLIVKTRMGIPIYVTKGKFTKHGEVEYLKTVKEKDGQYVEMKVKSTGNSKINCFVKAQIVKDKKLVYEYNIPAKVIGGENYYIFKDKIPADKIKEKGELTLRVLVNYKDEKDKKQNLKQEVPITL